MRRRNDFSSSQQSYDDHNTEDAFCEQRSIYNIKPLFVLPECTS